MSKRINWGNVIMKVSEERMTGSAYVFAGCLRIEYCMGKSFPTRNVYYAPDGSRFESEENLIKYMETGKKPKRN